MTETEITLRALTARARLSPEERRTLESESDAFAARHAKEEMFRATLAFFVGVMGGTSNAAPAHMCEFATNPEKGACEFCERWADALVLCGFLEDEDEPRA